MNLVTSMIGYIEVELVAADIPGTMAAMNGSDIPVFSVLAKDALTAVFSVRRTDWSKLRKLCEKRGDSLTLLRRQGIYWTGRSLLNRPVMLVGVLVLLTMIMYLPSRVLFVQVEGNDAVASSQIIEIAELCGIRFGASRREVRSEKMKNALLEAMPELQWAGVNTKGCVAVISVRERAMQQAHQENAVSSIVAAMDGIILSCTASSGNMLCVPGQAVKEGEVLISGYTDCGLTIQAEQAQGEIYAQTIHELAAVTPAEYTARVGPLVRHRRFSLIFGKKRINLWKDSGISDTTCGRMYEEYYVTLPGNYVLPIALAVDEYWVSDSVEAALYAQTAEQLLCAFTEDYLLREMIAGSIQNGTHVFSKQKALYRLEGKYVCTEMIGRVQREKIGEYNGENQ